MSDENSTMGLTTSKGKAHFLSHEYFLSQPQFILASRLDVLQILSTVYVICHTNQKSMHIQAFFFMNLLR